MKNIIIVIFVFMYYNEYIVAQNTPEFQYTLFIEDSRGKKDSAILGYDRTATYLTLEPRFGEVNIKQISFDSILEIRATEVRNRFDIQYHSKKIIVPYEGNCSQIAVSSIITLLIRAKYYPIKFSWNKSLFSDPCRGKSMMLNSETYFNIDPMLRRGADSIYSVTYMRDQSEKFEKFERRTPGGQPNPSFHYVFLAPTNDGRNDTIWTYSMVFRSEFIDKVVESPFQEIKNYPNPCFESLNLEFSDYETGKIDIYDLAGRNVKSVKVESTNQLKIDVPDLSIGMYYLKFKTTNGKIFVSKFVKS